MRCVSRRVADGTLLSVIKSWLAAPVIERDQRRTRCTTEAKDRHRGTPQGSPISPLLANLYFRRFLLAWERFGHRTRLDAHVINYADDLVICCQPGNGPAALAAMRQLMARLGLTVNEAKTRLARLPEESFDFLGYTIGRFYGKDGASYLGTCPSRKAVRRLLQRIHDATTPHKHAESPDLRVAAINRLVRVSEPVAESLLAGCWCDGKGAEELGSATTGWKAALGGLPFPFVRAVPDLRGTLDRVRV
jgi:hypothetical protein